MRYYNSMDFTSPYLKHHGIVGMKWGIRRYTNYDGTLTPEGIKRYGTYENLYKAYTQNKQGKKSGQQIQLEDEYRKKGYSKHEAEIRAIGQRQLEQKVFIGASAVTGATLSAVAVSRWKNVGKDVVYDNGEMVRATRNGYNNGSSGGKVMYARTRAKGGKDLDRNVYSGYHMRNEIQRPKETAWATKNGKLKIAGVDNAKKVYKDMLKNNPEFAKEVAKVQYGEQGDNTRRMSLHARGLFRGARDAAVANAHKRGQMSDKDIVDYVRKHSDYDTFNVQMVAEGARNSKAVDMYAKEMMKRGYNGVRDVNDNWYSTYGAKTASVIFTDQKLKQVGEKDLGFGEIHDMAIKGANHVRTSATIKHAMRKGIATGGIVASLSGLTTAKNHAKGAAYKKKTTSSKALEQSKRNHRRQSRIAKNLYGMGYSYSEIAKRLGISEGSVSSLLNGS